VSKDLHEKKGKIKEKNNSRSTKRCRTAILLIEKELLFIPHFDDV
jgi:hypothetical protein